MVTPKHGEQGFSTAGLMVGLLIGLLVCMTALSTFSFMEAQKRSTMGRNGALSNGSMALFLLETEAKHAGLGLVTDDKMLCQKTNLGYGKGVLLNGDPLYPILITDGGTGSDIIRIAYLSSITAASATRIESNMDSASGDIKVAQSSGFAPRNVLLLRKDIYANLLDTEVPDYCTLRQVESINPSGAGFAISHSTVATSELSTDPFNVDVTGYDKPVNYHAGDFISSSASFKWVTYSINNGALIETNFLTGASGIVADGVVGMKAEYGLANTSDLSAASITSWQAATGTYASPTPSAADMLKVRAIRVGIVVRSPERDNTCSTTTDKVAVWSGGPTVSLSGLADWKCYKYQTYSMIMPLLNMSTGIKGTSESVKGM